MVKEGMCRQSKCKTKGKAKFVIIFVGAGGSALEGASVKHD